jgi:DNA polymerase III, epsilon subunit and related 3''-5'' exonucleases
MTEAKYLVFDTETTGIDVFNDRIVQLFIATADSEGNLLETWEWIINPGVEVPEEASNVHGFTTGYLRENGQNSNQALEEAWDVLYDHWGLTHVAYNLAFDLSILHYEFERNGIDYFFGQPPRDMDMFDPLVVDRAKDKYRKGKRKLENVAAHYSVPFNPDEAHKADYDVKVTAKVAAAVAKQYGIPSNAEQAEMYKAWAENFESYLRRTDPDAVVDSDWPLKLKGD